jgi:hypothetical protein
MEFRMKKREGMVRISQIEVLTNVQKARKGQSVEQMANLQSSCISCIRNTHR